MPPVIVDKVTLLLYVLATISGAFGGCAVAAYQTLHKKKPEVTQAVFLAYAILGGFFGLLFVLYAGMLGYELTTLSQFLGHAALVGAAASVTLAASNFSIRFFLRRLGLEIEVRVKDRRHGED